MKSLMKQFLGLAIAGALVIGCSQPTEEASAATTGDVKTQEGTPVTEGTNGSTEGTTPEAEKPIKEAITESIPTITDDGKVPSTKPPVNEKPVETNVATKEEAIKAESGKEPQKPDAIGKPDPNGATKAPPRAPKDKASANDRLIATADGSKTASDYTGTWTFKLDPAKAKKLLDGWKSGGSTGAMYSPDYKMVLKSDGTFTAHEEFFAFKRDVVGTWSVVKGAAKLKINTVNGKAPTFASDKAGWVLVIGSDGRAERTDTIKFKK